MNDPCRSWNAAASDALMLLRAVACEKVLPPSTERIKLMLSWPLETKRVQVT